MAAVWGINDGRSGGVLTTNSEEEGVEGRGTGRGERGGEEREFF